MSLTYLTNPDGTVTTIDDGLPDVPAPDWAGFAAWLYQYPPMHTAMAAARGATASQGEPATTGLPVALQEVRQDGNYPIWHATWQQFLAASGMQAADVAAVAAKAAGCHLPAEFVGSLQP